MQFSLYTVLYSFRSVTSGPPAPISACLRSECCTGGESLAALRVNGLLALIHQRRERGETGR